MVENGSPTTKESANLEGEVDQLVEKIQRKRRAQRSFPASSFEEILEFAEEIFKIGSGQAVRRLTLFDHLGRSPESGTSRQLIINASRYGLTKGGVQAESLELTAEGYNAVNESAAPIERVKAHVNLAILNIEIFKRLYEKFCNTKIPSHAVLKDEVIAMGVEPDIAQEAVETFIVNLRFVGLLRTLSGAERIVSVDTLLSEIPSVAPTSINQSIHNQSIAIINSEQAQYESTCFYIAPIGSEGSEPRKHSDLFLGSIVEPALAQFQLKVVRADMIDKPGVITRQIIDYIMRSRLVIADLSFHNPNVFYELALRHAVKLPIVQIVRASDSVPFDVNQMRTIHIDTTDIYSLVPRLETYRAEIANQVRRALEPDHVAETPISVYFPNMKVSI